MQPICDSSNAVEPKIKILNVPQRDIWDFIATLLVGSLAGNNKCPSATGQIHKKWQVHKKEPKSLHFTKKLGVKSSQCTESKRTGFQKAQL